MSIVIMGAPKSNGELTSTRLNCLSFRFPGHDLLLGAVRIGVRMHASFADSQSIRTEADRNTGCGCQLQMRTVVVI
jgi:hypothetical protein